MNRELNYIGALNGTGNFFFSIAAPHTRFETQSLLMLTGIPIVLLASWIGLKKRPSGMASFAAFLIVGGNPDNPNNFTNNPVNYPLNNPLFRSFNFIPSRHFTPVSRWNHRILVFSSVIFRGKCIFSY